MEIKITSALVGILVALTVIIMIVSYSILSRINEIESKISAMHSILNSAEITQ